ncbi:MAG: 30S ribosomal protein S6 [Gemmatimonadetes bacterium]|nr:30S ribosomal protein S6 [Gemmatimonadota bacterium]
MRGYEVVYIFDPALGEAAITEKLARYHALVAGDGHGEVLAVDQWGTRQLAYPINKKTSGYYVVAQFRTDPNALVEFERMLKLDEDLMRHLIVLHEGEPTAPLSRAVPGVRRATEEGQEESDEDEEE